MRWAARQRAQQSLPKSFPLYSALNFAASHAFSLDAALLLPAASAGVNSASPPAATDCAPSPLVVLDTNVVLAWMVFRDPSVAPLAAAIIERRCRWLATAGMRLELDHVLSGGTLDRWSPDRARIAAQWEGHAQMVQARVPLGDAGRLRCSDADDQPFIDLALAHGARWLFSRDRAVLKLARRARQHGLSIVKPEQADFLDE